MLSKFFTAVEKDHDYHKNEWEEYKLSDIPYFDFGINKLVKASFQGAQSIVYLAYDKEERQIPILVKEAVIAPDRFETMVKAQSLASIYGIAPKIYAVQKKVGDARKVRVVMELIDSPKTLRDFVAELGENKFPEDLRDQIDTKVNLLSKLKIDHGDIHSDNVLISKGVVYIIDYDDARYPVDNIDPQESIELGSAHQIYLNKKFLPSLKAKLKQTKEYYMKSQIPELKRYANKIDLEKNFI